MVACREVGRWLAKRWRKKQGGAPLDSHCPGCKCGAILNSSIHNNNNPNYSSNNNNNNNDPNSNNSSSSSNNNSSSINNTDPQESLGHRLVPLVCEQLQRQQPAEGALQQHQKLVPPPPPGQQHQPQPSAGGGSYGEKH